MIEVLRRLRFLWAVVAIGLGVYMWLDLHVHAAPAVFVTLAMFLPLYLRWPPLIAVGGVLFGLSGFLTFAAQDIRFGMLGAAVFVALALLHWLLKPLWRRNT